MIQFLLTHSKKIVDSFNAHAHGHCTLFTHMLFSCKCTACCIKWICIERKFHVLHSIALKLRHQFSNLFMYEERPTSVHLMIRNGNMTIGHRNFIESINGNLRFCASAFYLDL